MLKQAKLKVTLKEGVQLVVDEDKINRIDGIDKGDLVPQKEEFLIFKFNLVKDTETINIDTLRNDDVNADIIELKPNKEVVIKTYNGDIIEGFKIEGNKCNNTKVDLFGGYFTAIRVDLDTLIENFTVIVD